MIDFVALQGDVLRVLRGARSTREVSGELGFSFDQFARWERGKVRLKWSDFVDLCELVGVDLRELFFQIYGFWSDEIAQPREFARQLLFFTVGPVGHKAIAKRLNVSQDLVERWLYGRAELTFADLCSVLNAFTAQTFFSWIDRLVNGKPLPSISRLQFQSRSEQSVHFAFPYAAAIEGALLMKEYQVAAAHSTRTLSDLTTLPVDLIERALPVLERAGRIRLEGDKFVVDQALVSAQGGTRLETSRLVRYWTERALLRFQTENGLPITKRNNPNAVLFRVAPLSKKATMAVTEALLKCHNEISAIVDSDCEPKEELRVLIGHHFSVDEIPEPPKEN